MDIRKLQRAIVEGLEDVKAQDIAVFDTEHLSPLFERVIVASGTSNRQTKALAASVRDAVKSSGFPVPRTEGEVNGEWIIVDCGSAVVHVMQPTIREYYHLEEIWGEKPVKLAAQRRTGLVKAEETDDEPVAKKAPAKKAAAKKTAAAKTPAAKAPARKATAKAEPAAKKAPAAKKTTVAGKKTPTAAKKAPAAKKAAAPRTIKVNEPVKKAPAKKVAAKKAAAPKAGVTRTTGVKTATKTAAKKAPAKKTAKKTS